MLIGSRSKQIKATLFEDFTSKGTQKWLFLSFASKNMEYGGCIATHSAI